MFIPIIINEKLIKVILKNTFDFISKLNLFELASVWAENYKPTCLM